jgi:uncharacterized membrane protein
MVIFLRSPIASGIANLWRSLERYPAPEKISWTRRSWFALGLVTLAVVLFCGYFCLYLTQEHLAYQTNAEDLGIMDQALWNTVHGQFLHQTICNSISDTNCVGEEGVMRFAIHFEPILLPISLLYLVFPDPRTLLVLQTIVVALGAYPAFFLTYRRLKHPLLAVILALLYLLYPAQQQATVYDFHAVTLTSTLLLFVIYLMYIRRTLWMFVFAFLAMACKEEISLVIVMLGLWSIILQHRWRSGLLLVAVGLLWFFLAVDVIMPYFSPTGHPLLITRFDTLGNGPLQVAFSIVRHPLVFFHQYVFESRHIAYLRILFIPALFLPLLAPWVTIITLPSILLNLVSSDDQMYSGLFQYNAEIVPVLLFATMEAVVVLTQLVRYLLLLGNQWAGYASNMRSARKGQYRSIEKQGGIDPGGEHIPEHSRPLWVLVVTLMQMLRFTALGHAKSVFRIATKEKEGIEVRWLMALLGLTLASSLHYDFQFYGNLPFSTNFTWPSISSHAALAQRFIRMIPPTAAVSAQSPLVPHISERYAIYLFPYASNSAEYIFLDVTGDIYPYYDSSVYERAVYAVLSSGYYGILAWDDGYLLLKRGLSPPTTATLDTIFAVPRYSK